MTALYKFTPLLTSVAFLAPLFIYRDGLYAYFRTATIQSTFLAILIGLVILITISSLTFWKMPIKGETYHIIDSYLARITIVAFVVYNILYNTKTLKWFVIVLLLMLLMFYLSDEKSNAQWGSRGHIFFHIMLHLFCIAGLSLTLMSLV